MKELKARKNSRQYMQKYSNIDLSRSMTKPTKWPVRPEKNSDQPGQIRVFAVRLLGS